MPTPPVETPKPTEAAPPAPAQTTLGNPYQDAALKLFEQAEPEVKPPEPEVAKPAEEPKPPEPVVVKPAEPEVKPPEPPAPAPENKGFDALVREKAMLRKREAELTQREAKYAEIEKALESNDPIGYLHASKKFTYEQLVAQLVQGKKPEAAEPTRQAHDPVLKEVQELKAQLMNERAEANRAKAHTQVLELVRTGGEQFKFTAGRKAEGRAVAYLENYFNETGQLPAPTIEESLRLSLEAVEANLREEAKSWEPLLTSKQAPVSLPAVVAKEAVDPAKDNQASQQSTTLTNSQVAPSRPVQNNLKTPEDYQRAALAALLGAEPTT